jgi:hypothetical protein
VRGGPLDELRRSPLAVHSDRVAGVALQVDVEVGPDGLVAARHHLEDAALGRQQRDPAMVGEQAGKRLRGGVIGQHPGCRWDMDRGGRPGRADGVGEKTLTLLV